MLTAAALNIPVNHVSELPIDELLLNQSRSGQVAPNLVSPVSYGTKGSSLSDFFEELEKGSATKNMWKLMQEWETTHFRTWDELQAFAKKNRGSFAMIRKKTYLENVAARDPDCSLFVLSGTLNDEYLGIAMHKNLDAKIRKDISKTILGFAREGLLQSLQSYYWQKQTCSMLNAEKIFKSSSSLGMDNFVGVIILIIFFYCLGIFTFSIQALFFIKNNQLDRT